MQDLSRRYLLGNALKVTESLLPELYNLYQECLNRIGDNLEGNLYVQQQSDYKTRYQF